MVRRLLESFGFIFQSPTLRGVFLVSLAIIVAVPLVNSLFVYPSFTQLLIEDVTKEAERVAGHMMTMTRVEERALAQGVVDPALAEHLHQLQKEFGLMKLKLYSPQGLVLYSSLADEIGKINKKSYFRQIVAKGKTHSTVVRRGAPSLEGPPVWKDVVEVYVPIMKGGLFLGAFEIYYDITTRLQAIERLISHSTLAVVALSGGLLVLLLMVSFKMAQSQAALRESEARFRALTEGALAGVYIIQDGVFRYVNPALAQFFGYTPEEIIDKLGPTDLTCPEDRPLVAEQVRRRLAGEVEAVHYSFRGLRKDGSILHCEVLGRRIDYRGKPAIMGTFLDVTERKEAEQALRESEERFRGISASAQDAIIMMDPEGRISYWNQAAENIFGYKAEEAIGQFLDKLIIPEALRADFQRGLREFRKTGQGPAVGQRVEFNALRKGGQEFPVELSLSSLQIGGQWNAIGMVRDVTERKRAEEELRSAHRELQEAYEALEKAHASAIAAEKMAALGRLTAGVSHEILNPLFVVSMNLRLLLTDSELPSHVAEKLREVDEQVHRIDKITQNLLYFARKRKPERRPLNLNDTIRRTIELMDHDLRLKGITVELDLDEGLPTLAADQDQLQQVILNLMTNARDAVAEGGRITLTTRLIEDGKPSVELRVEDTGPGIDPKHMDKIFDPFFTTKPEGEGTGLGLSICQGIVEAHGGAIWAENVPGKGAAFVVRLEVE